MIIPPDQNLQETGLAAAVAAKARRRKPGLASDRHRLGLLRSVARGRRLSYITVHPGYGRKSSGAGTYSTFSSIKRETNALFIIFTYFLSPLASVHPYLAVIGRVSVIGRVRA